MLGVSRRAFPGGKVTYTAFSARQVTSQNGAGAAPGPEAPGGSARPRQSRQRGAGRAAYLGFPQSGRTLTDPRDASAERNAASGHARRRAPGARQHRRRRHRPREPLGGDTRRHPEAPEDVPSRRWTPRGTRGRSGLRPAPPSPATFRILPRPTLSARRGTPVPSRENSATSSALPALRAAGGKEAVRGHRISWLEKASEVI